MNASGEPDLREVDPEIFGLIEAEDRRQRDSLRLIASENYASKAVLQATGTSLTNKYAEGYPGRRYYEGMECVDPIETLAVDRAKELFGAEHANVQPYSGSPANLAVLLGLCDPGDTIMGLSLPAGGHLTFFNDTAATAPTAGRSAPPASTTTRSSTASAGTITGSTWTRSATSPANTSPS